jgi:hypothetical protein
MRLKPTTAIFGAMLVGSVLVHWVLSNREVSSTNISHQTEMVVGPGLGSPAPLPDTPTHGSLGAPRAGSFLSTQADNPPSVTPAIPPTSDSSKLVSTSQRPEDKAFSSGPLLKITADSILLLIRDCPGQMVSDCDAMGRLAARISQAPDQASDGWSDWVETEILASLSSIARANHLSEVGVKCSSEGCVILVSAKTSRDAIATPLMHDPYDLDAWLANRAWASEFSEISWKGGSRSIAAWRVIGTDSAPYLVWYVVRRRD